jgi:hypothetical protein
VVGELEPSQHYMYLGIKNEVNNKNYIEFVEAIDKLNKEAARRFTELYPFLDQTKANNIEIKSSIGKGVIYVQDFGGEIYAGFEE